MTPEKALAILEGRITHRSTKDLPRVIPEQKETSPAVSIPKILNLMTMLLTVLLGGILIAFYLWRVDGVSRDAYMKGYHNGLNAVNVQMPQKLITSSDNLKMVVRQRYHLLKELKKQPAAERERHLVVTQNVRSKVQSLTAAGFKQVTIRVTTLLLYTFPEIKSI